MKCKECKNVTTELLNNKCEFCFFYDIYEMEKQKALEKHWEVFNKLIEKKFKILKKATKDEMKKPKEKQDWDKLEKKWKMRRVI